jgi:hypothetical protein
MENKSPTVGFELPPSTEPLVTLQCPLSDVVELPLVPQAGKRYSEHRTEGVPCPAAGNNLCYSADCGPGSCASEYIEEHPPQRNLESSRPL